jgi:hypothetical protein
MPSWFGRILADTDQSSKKRIGAVSDKQRGGPEWGRPFDFSNDYYGLTLILFEFLVTGVSALSSTLAVAVMNTVPVLVKHRSSNLYFPAVFVPVPVMPTGGTPEAQGIPGANRMLVGVPLLVDVDSVIFVPFTRSVPDVAVAVREKRSVFTFMGVFTGVSAKLTLETFFNPILLQHLLLRPPTPPGDSTAAMSGLGVRRPVAERTSRPARWNGPLPSSCAKVCEQVPAVAGVRKYASSNARMTSFTSLTMAALFSVASASRQTPMMIFGSKLASCGIVLQSYVLGSAGVAGNP